VHIGTCEFCTIEEFRPVAESREQQVQYTVRIMSIDKYDPIRLLGEGSFGKVYLMRDKVRRNFVCVKVIKIKNIPKKEREATKLEVDLLRRLHHPNIVRYLDSFLSKNNETLCICMEYCDGGDLASQIKAARQNLFSESKILHWFVQLALGLHYMHSSKVLHRDLKTQNVFLLGNGRLVLGDLGISKVLDGTMDFAQTCIGTPYCKSYL
jgi:NIMA (never in mitosis gene a)-related kinase